MGKIISVSNQKGGVGKTTTAVNLSSFIASQKKVLLIDLDSQGNAGFGLGFNSNEIETTIYEVLIGRNLITEAIYKTKVKNLDLIPSNINLAGAQIDLTDFPQKEFILRETLNKISDNYDYIFIDTPPSLGILTLNGLVAADSVIIPLQCEYYALEGLNQLLKIICTVQENLNKNLKIEGVVLTMFDSRTNLSRQIVADVHEYFQDNVFRTIIPRNIRLSEAPSYGEPINFYDRNSRGSLSYQELALEVMNNA